MVDDGPGAALERIRERREWLAGTADDLERAVTRAAGVREPWLTRVRVATERLQAALAAHVEEVEAPGGLFADITARTPRLVPAIDQLHRDHAAIATQIGELEVLLDADAAVDAIREDALALLHEISRHRHRGADLLWESYDVDIGGGD